ncbi:hypothetical protein ACOALZ_03775 [Nocardiopsis algeriensis]|uniref:hypothetical protein n=1 Tax=Nocardiopsis algeriensis TaxID=1478215 RepID=UPI003B43796E
MPWDARERQRYEEEVLTAARTGGPPEDLFVRYGIGPGLERRLGADPEAFRAHVAAVCTYWRGMQSRRRSLRKVLVDLVAAHERLEREGVLTHGHFHRVRAEAAGRALTEWSDIAGGLSTSVLERQVFQAMARSVGVNEETAERVLGERGVRVVEQLPQLPLSPPVRTFRTLRDNLRTCGAAFSPAVVFGSERLARGFTLLEGFRLRDGTVLDDEALAAAVRRIQVEPMTEGKAAAENVLSILRSCEDPPARDALVLWEVVGDLRERPGALGEKGLARPWIHRGLADQEALLLAASVRRSASAAGSGGTARAEHEVRELLGADRLRRAQAVAADLPRDHGLAELVRERVRRVEDLLREADRELRGGDSEAAARALDTAARLAADDGEIPARLGEVEPLPPRAATADTGEHGAVVSWQPSPSLAGRISYRVARRIGRGPGAREVPLGELSGTSLTDTGIPVGAEVRYAVAAVRCGRAVSEPVVTPPVMLTPEVGDLLVHTGEDAVTATWRVPPEAVSVEVVRGEGAPPRPGGDVVRVPNDGTGFRDTGVRSGTEYFYRIRAVYLTSSGHARGSAGTIRRVVPGPAPVPVDVLRVVPGDSGFVAEWTRPPHGRVVLRAAAEPPPWPEGAAVPLSDLAVYGRELLPAAVPAGTAPPAHGLPAPDGVPLPRADEGTGAPRVSAEVAGPAGPGAAAGTPSARARAPFPEVGGRAADAGADGADEADAFGAEGVRALGSGHPAASRSGGPPAEVSEEDGRAAAAVGEPSAVPVTAPPGRGGTRRAGTASGHVHDRGPGGSGTAGSCLTAPVAGTPVEEAAPVPLRTGHAGPAGERTRPVSGTGPEKAPEDAAPPEDAGPDGVPAGHTPRGRVGADAADRVVSAPVALEPGAHHVLAVTLAGDRAVAGARVRMVAVPPVAGLRAERFDGVVRLGWTWPDGAATAAVSWCSDESGEELGRRVCTRLRYESDGGFEAPMGTGSVRVAVRTLVTTGTGEAAGVPAVTTVPGWSVLAYRIAPVGLLRRERRVSLTAESACAAPEIAVVHAEGAVQPHGPGQGRVLAVFPARHLDAGEQVSLRVRPPRSGWLMCFPVGGDTPGVRLRQPSVKELRL